MLYIHDWLSRPWANASSQLRTAQHDYELLRGQVGPDIGGKARSLERIMEGTARMKWRAINRHPVRYRISLLLAKRGV